jgi:hypothetical protein
MRTYSNNKGLKQLRDAMVWAHGAGCPCDSALHRRAGGYLQAAGAKQRRRLQWLDVIVFWCGFCVCWRHQARFTVKHNLMEAVCYMLYAYVLVPLTSEPSLWLAVVQAVGTVQLWPFILIGLL